MFTRMLDIGFCYDVSQGILKWTSTFQEKMED